MLFQVTWNLKSNNFRYLNYYEGRKFPYSYEKEIYELAREKLSNEDELADIGCRETVDAQLEDFRLSTKTVLESNAMKNPGMFS